MQRLRVGFTQISLGLCTRRGNETIFNENVQLVCYECALEVRKVASPVGRESPQSSKFSKARNMSEKLANVKINGLERKLKQSEVDFMKLIEEQNVTRVLKLKKTRKNNLLTGEWNFLESFRHPH